MSSNDPGEPEYLEADQQPRPEAARPRRSVRRTGIIAASAVAVVAAVGGGAYGVSQLMSGGDSAASAVPADAVAYATLDLDPSAAQKIEAVKIFRKFPSLRSELNIGSRDDLRRTAFDALVKDGGCKDVDFDKDVKPWLGNRLGVAAVPGAGARLLPLVALQVTDEDKARAGVRTLEKCEASDSGSADPVGVAFVGDYMLLTEKKNEADAMAKDAASGSLADDEDYQTWTKRAGDPGILTMYASKAAPSAVLDERARGEAGGSKQSTSSRKQLEAAFKDFEGASGVVRFKDGAMEAELTTKGLGKGIAADTASGPDVRTLPGTTAAALSVAFKDGWAKSYLDTIKDMGGGSFDSLLSNGERSTGLTLPDDIETLLGDGFDVSVDSRTDLDALSSSPDPTKVPAGIRIKGDTAKVTAVIDKLKAKAGPSGDLLQVRSKDGIVAVGTDQAYVEELLTKGDLGGTGAFTRVVPDAGKANGVLFVSFDAGNGWAERLADLVSDGDPKVKENVKPLDALGISSWQDDDQVQHSLLRLTTD
jgi:hypothetical protein